MLFSKLLQPFKQILYVYANNIQQGSTETGGDILVSSALGLRVTTLAASIGNSGTNSMGVMDLTMGQSQQQAKRHKSGGHQSPHHSPAHPSFPSPLIFLYLFPCAFSFRLLSFHHFL